MKKKLKSYRKILIVDNNKTSSFKANYLVFRANYKANKVRKTIS